MGRWGHCLFEGDQDLDLVSDISYDVFKDNQPDPTKSTKADQPDSEEDEEDFDPSKDLLLGDVAAIRAKLDGNGTGDALLAEYRAKEGEFQGQYRILLLGALMMRAGARIRADDLQHLRELVPQVTCNEGSTFVLWDDGFRGPGKRQFLAALDAYKEGVPRDFRAASCFNCGKIKDDTGKEPMCCAKCKAATYCGKNCQKSHWSRHKSSCTDPEQRIFMNV